MGSQQSSYEDRFYNKYNFIQPLQDRNFGQIKVYRKRQVNFDYVMVLERLVPQNQIESNRSELEQIKKSFSLEQQPMLLRLYHVQMFRRSTCGGQGLKIYMEYLNYSLKDEIQQRKLAFQAFNLDQIMYIINSTVETFLFFNGLQYNYLAIRSDAIFITVEGYLRFSPVKVIDFQEQDFNNCDCMPEPIVHKYFQKSERQFLIEFKNLLHEIVSICPRNDQNYRKSYQILSNINSSRTIANMKPFIWNSTLQCLNVAKKGPQSTELSTVRDQLTGSFRQSEAISKRSLRESRGQSNR